MYHKFKSSIIIIGDFFSRHLHILFNYYFFFIILIKADI